MSPPRMLGLRQIDLSESHDRWDNQNHMDMPDLRVLDILPTERR